MGIILVKAFIISGLALIISYFGIKFIMKHMKQFLIILGTLTFCTCVGFDIYFSKFYQKNETAIKVSEEIKDELTKVSEKFDIHDYVIKNVKQKDGVNMTVVSEIDTALYEIIEVYRKILNDPKYMPLITSANDYIGHSKNSAHYHGKAIDIRIKDLDKAVKKNIIDVIKVTLGNNYTVLHEDVGTANEHLHVQLKRS